MCAISPWLGANSLLDGNEMILRYSPGTLERPVRATRLLPRKNNKARLVRYIQAAPCSHISFPNVFTDSEWFNALESEKG